MELLLRKIEKASFDFENNLHSNMELLLQMHKVSGWKHILNLHSNMELLLQGNFLVKRCKDMIYIPIWSYFYKITTYKPTMKIPIYIPIWSYFYLLSRITADVFLPFTFQYGATSTNVIEGFTMYRH